jgi:hypothetical protein
MNKKLFCLLGFMVVISMLMASCAPETIIQTVVVTEIVEGEVVEVVITTTPAPTQPPVVEEEEPAASYDMAPDTTTMTYVMPDDAASLDPHLAYEGTSYEIIMNIVEPLIAYNRDKASEYIPMLALEVPTVANGGLSEDGLTYTFKMRPGVTFENGNPLTASDVAYSWERVLLQSDPNSGAWMMLEAIMGYSSGDITENIAEGAYSGDQGELIANTTPEELLAVCEEVKARFEVDDAAGTFKVTLPSRGGRSWPSSPARGPTSSTRSGPRASAIGTARAKPGRISMPPARRAPSWPRSSTAPAPTSSITGPLTWSGCWSPTRTTGARKTIPSGPAARAASPRSSGSCTRRCPSGARGLPCSRPGTPPGAM